MKLSYLVEILFILFLNEIIQAQNLIDFDNQGWTTDQSLGSNFAIDNFSFSSNKNFYTNYGYNFDVYNVSLYFVFQDPNADKFTITTPNNELIELNSIAVYQVSESSTDTLIIEGWNGSDKKYTSSFWGVLTWQVLSLNYENINKIVVKLKSSGYENLSDYNFDNFSYNNISTPVELTSFGAITEKNYIKLQWETSTELNNYGFDIERRGNENIWLKIDFIKGEGNSTTPKSYSFKDYSIQNDYLYIYRLKQIDNNGSFKYSKEVEVHFASPQNWALAQNYPNPFNSSTSINYQISKPTKVLIKLYDITGKEITILVNDYKSEGNYSIVFNAENLSSGIYIYKLITNEFVSTKKMVLIK